MQGFYWLIEDELAGCGLPGRGRPVAWSERARQDSLDEDLEWLRERGIGAVLTLTEEAQLRVRAVCPGALENAEQQRALVAFAERRDWIV